MDLESPEFTPLFDQQLLAEGDEIEGDEEKDEEMLARLLREEPDDEEDDAILCAAQASRPVSALSGDMASTVGDCDLVEVCKRAAAKLDIPWPVTPGDPGVKQDIYDGKRLPSRLPPAKQLLPALPACIAEMKRSWDKPFSHRVPVKGYSSLDVSEMEGLGLSNLPTVEQSVAHHLHPNRRTTLSSASPSLPGKMERFTASMYQKIYKSSALAVRALNVTSLLTAYQAELLEELGTQLDTDKFGKAINEGLPIILCYFASRNTIGIMEGRYEEVLHLLTNNEFPVRYNKTARQTLRRYAAKFRVTDGMLYYGGRKAVKTKEECTALFCMSHISPVGNHCGKQKTRNALCEKYYWPGMTADIEKWVNVSLCDLLDISLRAIVAYHPETNSFDEKNTENTKRALTKLRSEHQNEWDVFLEPAMFVQRTKVHKTTKLSPFMLMYGREARFPSQVAAELPIIDSYLHIIGKNMKGRVFVLSAVVSSALFSGNFQCVRKDSQETLSDECPEELPSDICSLYRRNLQLKNGYLVLMKRRVEAQIEVDNFKKQKLSLEIQQKMKDVLNFK
ncbi:copper homeostasis cutC -like protein [Labeo rohita]|uniref:Gypsy retrotransposon integrase-like protein 1 n=1 Tax=Labeo rohita TaxID=84645 RepID=A0A498NF96_LABRO|nr:copper homeostasis cutC -like protein [Labeo rohita]